MMRIKCSGRVFVGDVLSVLGDKLVDILHIQIANELWMHWTLSSVQPMLAMKNAEYSDKNTVFVVSILTT